MEWRGFDAGGDTSGQRKRFADYQPEGPLKGTIFDYVPDAHQVSAWLMDRFGGFSPSRSSDQGSIREKFNKAFRVARDKGEDEFSFLDKRYHTKTREEVQKKAIGGMTESPVAEAPLQASPQAATDVMQDPITQEVIMFLVGETDNQQVVNDFIAKYGNEMFLQLRNSVLQSLVPGAETEGQIMAEGQSGMSDDIPGMIGSNEKIAVSQDEFIVPADVVSGLGDGSSDSGSDRLYEMMDRVRQAKTGGTTQPPRIDPNKMMPA